MSFRENIEQYWLVRSINSLIVAEIIELRDNSASQYHYKAILLSKRKKQIKIERKIISNKLEEFVSWIKARSDIKILLLANSDKILHKTYSKEILPEHSDILNEMIPGAPPDDFYSQVYTINEDQQFLSVIRKSHLNHVVQQLGEIHDRVVHLAIGPFPVFFSMQLFGGSSNENLHQISFQNYHFSFEENRLSNYKINPYKPDEVILNNKVFHFFQDNVPENILMVYSLGLYFLLYPKSTVGISAEKILYNHEEFIYEKESKGVIFASLILILVLLVTSSLIYSIYRDKYQQLQEAYTQKEAQYRAFEETQGKLKIQEEILEKSGIVKSSTISFYADQLTKLLPSDIYLQKLEIHPKNGSGVNGNIMFNYERITVEGNCYSGHDLNDWINRIKALTWIKDVIITNFKQENIEEMGSFYLEIIKKDA